MDISKYTKQTLLDAKLSVEFFPAEQVGQIATDLSTTVDSRLATINTSIQNIHTHDNKAVLDGITAEKVSAWDGAEVAAKSYADEKATAAETAAKSYVDGLASNYDAAGAAAAAETAAKGYTDSKVGGLTATYDAKGAAATAEANANSYTDTTVRNLIDGAPEAYDTLKEIADWIANDESGVSALTNRVAALETGVDALETDVGDIGRTLDAASQVQRLPTDGSISTRAIIDKVNELIGALVIQHTLAPGG